MIDTSRRPIPLLLVLLFFAGMTVEAQDARVEYVDGDVRVESGGSRQTADFGMPLEEGDVVVTGSDGVAVVSLGEGSRIKLRENTVVTIDARTSAGSVELRQGGIFARVRQAATGGRRSFEVRTPTVVAGVRGTEFFVAYGRTIEDLPDVWLCVNEGAVEISIREVDEVTVVEEGEGVNILSGVRATEPRFYPWTTQLNWNFDPDEGEVRDTTDLDGAYSDLLDQDYD
ncbi:MAG: FecR family protein [Spirochaetota bacterium]